MTDRVAPTSHVKTTTLYVEKGRTVHEYVTCLGVDDCRGWTDDGRVVAVCGQHKRFDRIVEL